MSAPKGDNAVRSIRQIPPCSDLVAASRGLFCLLAAVIVSSGCLEIPSERVSTDERDEGKPQPVERDVATTPPDTSVAVPTQIEACEIPLSEHAEVSRWIPGPKAAKALEDYRNRRFERAARTFDKLGESQRVAERGAVQFLAALSHFRARHDRLAATRFADLWESYPTLRGYHAFYAAKAFYRARAYESAIAWGKRLRPSDVFAEEGSLLVARSMWRLRDASLLTHLMAHETRWGESAPTAYLRARVAGLDNREAEEEGLNRVIEAWPESWSATSARRRLGIDAIVEEPNEVAEGRELRKAHRLFERHSTHRAIRVLTKLVAKLELGSEAWCEATLLLGRSYDKLRRRGESVPLYRELRRVCLETKWAPEILYRGGDAHFQEDHFELAVSFFDQLQRVAPDSERLTEALYLMGVARGKQGDRRGMDRILRRVVREDPASRFGTEAGFRLVREAFQEGKFEDAVDAADFVEEARGDDVGVRGRLQYWRARAQQKEGERDAALEGYERILAQYPLSYYANLSLARVAELRDHGQARDLFQRVSRAEASATVCLATLLGGGDDASARMAEGVELLRIGLDKLARNHFRAIDNKEDTEDARWMHALLLSRMGEHRGAYVVVKSAFPELMEHYPRQPHHIRWSLAFPRPYEEEMALALRESTGIEANFVYAVMRHESGFREGAESSANAVGLMQLLPSTARGLSDEPERFRSRDLEEPGQNIRLGARYLSNLWARTDSPALVAAAYNAGGRRLCSWLEAHEGRELDEFVEAIPYRGTRNYVRAVVRNYGVYQYLASGEPLILESTILEQCNPRQRTKK